MNSLTVRELFEKGERLGIRQIAEPPDVCGAVERVWICQREMLGGCHPTIFPHTMVLIPSAIGAKYRCCSHRDSPPSLAYGNISCAALCEARRLPDLLLRYSEKTGIPVFTSSYHPILLKSRLTGLLKEKSLQAATVHGVLIAVSGIGILLMGRSGIGKTLCGLEVVSRGGFFIADDAVVLEAQKGVLLGRGHVRTRGLIALSGERILRAEELVGMDRIREYTVVHGIVQFIGNQPPDETGVRNGKEKRSVRRLIGIDLPCRHIVSDGDPRHMADAVLDIVGELYNARSN